MIKLLVPKKMKICKNLELELFRDLDRIGLSHGEAV